MKNQLAFPPNNKYHIGIGLILGIWIYLFLVLIGPFDAFPLRMGWRAQIMVGYGLCFTLSYLLIIPLQTFLYKKLGKWNSFLEGAIVFLVFLISYYPCYFYYKSEFILGEYVFLDFLFKIYVPTSSLLLPALLLFRWAISKYATPKESLEEKVKLYGEHNLDILHIRYSSLICVKSANNYVEVFYLRNEVLKKKLLRTTTKKVLEEIPQLVQIHRSYLINPDHFIEWKDRKHLSLSHIEVPVSDTYKDNIRNLLEFCPY